MPTRIPIIALLSLFLCYPAEACLNGVSILLKDGTAIYQDPETPYDVPYGHSFSNAAHLKQGVQRLERLWTTTGNIDFLSDKGLLLIVLKRYDEAVSLYQKIELLKPGRYATASNMGTAYELLGENEKALQWIRKAVTIDPASHQNSEWIHVKILEAKIRGDAFYTGQFLLNTDFGAAPAPTTHMATGELGTLYNALHYQLNERISFVKPKDKIVAQLLFELGNVALLLNRYDEAQGEYSMAKQYGFSRPLIELRITEAVRRNAIPYRPPAPQALPESQPAVAPITNDRSAWRLVLGGVAVIALAFMVYRRRARRPV